MWLSWGLFICVFAGLTLPIPARVVSRFSEVQECLDFFMDNYTPQLPGVMVDDTIQDQNRFRLICQYYQNKYRYATLYDSKNKIPVFSAYVYKGKNGKSCKPWTWFIEPQLDGQDGPAMSAEKTGISYNNQARPTDYHEIGNLSRGHILPKCYAYDKSDRYSTFTLTNIVPQVKTFNGGSWCRMENRVKDLMETNCRDNNNVIQAYGVTGAVPSNGTFLNNKVNIPTLMWTAFCCYNAASKTWMSLAHWAYNEEEKEKDKTIPPQSLTDLHNYLSDFYPQVSIFPDKCLNVTVEDSLSNKGKESTEDEGCSCEDNEDICDNTDGAEMLYGGSRKHTLFVFSVSAILIIKHLQ